MSFPSHDIHNYILQVRFEAGRACAGLDLGCLEQRSGAGRAPALGRGWTDRSGFPRRFPDVSEILRSLPGVSPGRFAQGRTI